MNIWMWIVDIFVYLHRHLRRQVSSWRLFQVLYNGLGLVHLFWLLFGTVIIIPPAMLEGFYMRCTHPPPDV